MNIQTHPSMASTTGARAAIPTSEDRIAEHIAERRAYYGFAIRLTGKRHLPGARLNLVEQQREWRHQQDTAARAIALAGATS